MTTTTTTTTITAQQQAAVDAYDAAGGAASKTAGYDAAAALLGITGPAAGNVVRAGLRALGRDAEIGGPRGGQQDDALAQAQVALAVAQQQLADVDGPVQDAQADVKLTGPKVLDRLKSDVQTRIDALTAQLAALDADPDPAIAEFKTQAAARLDAAQQRADANRVQRVARVAGAQASVNAIADALGVTIDA